MKIKWKVEEEEEEGRDIAKYSDIITLLMRLLSIQWLWQIKKVRNRVPDRIWFLIIIVIIIIFHRFRFVVDARRTRKILKGEEVRPCCIVIYPDRWFVSRLFHFYSLHHCLLNTSMCDAEHEVHIFSSHSRLNFKLI